MSVMPSEFWASNVQYVVAVSTVLRHTNIFAKWVDLMSNVLITKNKINKEGRRELLEVMFMASILVMASRV